LTTSPSYSESISFISFIASMMQRTSPFFTVDPTSTKAGALGSEALKKVPTMGDFTIANSASSETAAAGPGTASGAGAGRLGTP
jgi:hypothetical protein